MALGVVTITKYYVITHELKTFINEKFVWSINNRYIYKQKCTMKIVKFINSFINEIIKLYNYGVVITNELKQFINEKFVWSINNRYIYK